MPRLDKYHLHVREALEKDGWTITHDPYPLEYDDVEMSIDLGAERILAAQKGTEKIAVEVKSFTKLSLVNSFHEALGQYEMYDMVLQEVEPDRLVYLAVREFYFRNFLSKPLGQLAIRKKNLRILVFDEHLKKIIQWIK
jgi:XisH protein